MKQTGKKTLLLIAIAMTASLFGPSERAQADCCHASCNLGLIGTVYAYTLCEDCTAPTPYCGYGECNWFGCNCDGGCRVGPNGPCTSSGGGSCPPSSLDADSGLRRFKAIDQDSSGTISLEEAKTWAKSELSELTAEEFEKGFLKVDKDHNGKIDLKEFDQNVAAQAANALGADN